MKGSMFKSDWFTALVITIAFIIFAGSNFIQSIERSAYDFGVKSSTRVPSNKVAIIAIDDQSIANIGRWPWTRDVHAQMHDILTEGGAKAIGQTVFFLEPQRDPGLHYIKELRTAFASPPPLIDEPIMEDEAEQSTLESSQAPSDTQPMATEQSTTESVDAEQNTTAKTEPDEMAAEQPAESQSTKETAPQEPVVTNAVPSPLTEIADFLQNSPEMTEAWQAYYQYLLNAETLLDTDRTLAESMQRGGNVVLAMPFIPGDPLGRPDEDLPDYVRVNRLPDQNIIDGPQTNPEGRYPISTVDAIPPIPVLGKHAAGIGSLVILPDVDGGIREEPLIINHFDEFYPSMALLLAAKGLNLSLEDIKVTVSSKVQLGNLNIKTDDYSLMNTFFYHSDNYEHAFPVDSFFDVLQGKIPASKYKNKIVLIGSTAYGVGDSMVTPIDPAMPPVVTLAHSVSSILNEDFFVVPEWSLYATIGAIALVALYLMLVLPKLGAAIGFTLTALLLIALFMTHYILMTTQGMWVQLMLPILLLITGHLLLTTKGFLLSERGKARLDVESAESNRMLGLSMQGQGQLDMAFEKFRKLPVDKSVLELLYNLALDYERKRQFNKAKSVYDYMLDHDAKFRDIKDRSNRAKAMEETVVLGGGGGSSPGGTLIMEGSGMQKPMLGRYEVERELGKGAMGAVYLGKDPKISRVVAIKTMALSQEFEDDELQDVKDRFFREAETAGRLTHPHIVTIYDAGEEHDLAYIAMEFLKGTDMTKYIKKDSLLPFSKVLLLIKQAAEALSYAHNNNVVHRDIKPANIMWDPETDSMKITDFGIARITDSSKTKTGMVLGTPSYMSPEQLAGKKVSGQSDIFSLGVMLYQMITGELPFKGDSMATLMYKIANEAHPAPETINADIPRCVSLIINRSLEKDTEKRYKTGAQMAEDLAKCLKILAAEGK